MTQPTCSCIVCKKVYSIRGIHSHYISSHTIEGKERRISSGKTTAEKTKDFYIIQRIKKIESYTLSPKLCIECSSPIPYEKKQNKCCSSKCSIKQSHKNRPIETYKSKTWNLKRNTNPKLTKSQKLKLQEVGPFCRVYKITCSHCKCKIIARSQIKYCEKCSNLYSHSGRAKYWFTFNVFNYPELFDLSLIKIYGFRDSKTNPNGITRDHRISVNEAIRNNYDPYYIKHPLNCELMFFNENNKKKTKCSISFSELVILVDNYDKQNGMPTPI